MVIVPGYPTIDLDRQMTVPVADAHTPTSLLAAEVSAAMSRAADDTAKPRVSAGSLLQQLQMAGDHIPLLQSIMQRELQSITPTSQQLQLAHIAQQQRSAGAPQAPQHTPQNSNRVEVVPLAGLCLMHLMAGLQQQQQQCNAHTSRSSSTNAEQAGHSSPHPAEAAAATTAADIAPGGLLEAMKHCSPFVNALHSELCSLRKVSSSCYTQIMQQLAAVGRHLPPAAAGSDRRSSSGSNDVPTQPHDGSRASEVAPYARAAGGADSSTNNSNSSGNNGSSSSSGSYYGRDLDLPLLQQQADNAALDLIHLEDCISSSVTRLSCLAQQYDIMITAALAAAAEHAGAAADARLTPNELHHHHQQQQQQQGGTAGEAPGRAAGARKGHGFLGPLLDAVRGHKGSKDDGQQQQRPEAIEYVFMQPGVCSHSNAGQVHSYSAGVPADVYSTSVNKLLRHSACSERVIWMLSVIYARLRHATEAALSAAAAGSEGQAGAAAGAKQWSAPDKFTRSTTKYWIHPSNVLRLKLALTKQLPLLVYGADDPVSSGDIAAAAAEAAGSSAQGSSEQHKVTSLVSSVYFDGPGLPVYHTRLARLDGAKLVRIRYYGQRQVGEAGGSQAVFVEQKTHRDKAMGETSFKERGCLQQSQLPAFLSRSVPLEQMLGPKCKKVEHLAQVQDFLINEKQAPILRTEYLRSAWQAYDDNAVRFSLDEHMLLLREAPPAAGNSSSGSSGGWCRPLESLHQIPSTDAVRFPYAVLEIKLQDKKAAPAWVHELKTSGVIVEVPRFSKFLHGSALLQPTTIREVPAWFAWREAARINLPASLDEMWDMTAERRAKKEMDWQDDLEFLRSQDPTAGALTPDIDAMLALLKAPRAYTAAAAAAAGTAAPMLSPAVSLSALSAATAASKLLLPAGPSYELTATAAAAPATATQDLAGPQPPAATASCAGQLYSYPCEVHTDVHTSSSIHSHSSSSSTDPQVHALRGPAHSIMQDGQFGCAGDAPATRCRNGGGITEYRGAGGSMQPLLGLTDLPGGRGSFSCSRAPGGYLADSPTAAAGEPDRAGVDGNSPTFGSNHLSVRLTPPHRRSLSSDSLASSLLHASHSSSSCCMGPTAPEAAMPHLAIYSSSPSFHSPSHSNTYRDHCHHSDLIQQGYPRVHLSNEYGSAGREMQCAGAPAGAAADRCSMRPGSHGSSSGGTNDSWRLSTVNPLFALARGSATPPAASAQHASGKAVDSCCREVTWGAVAHPLATVKSASDQDRACLGFAGGNDVVVDFGKLGGQGAAALLPAGLSMTAAAVAAGAGRPQVVQVHYTGAVDAVVPVHPSPRQVRELSQLLPPSGPISSSNGSSSAATTAVVLAPAAADAAGEGSGMRDQMGMDGVAADSSQGSKGVKGKGSRGYRQRVQQWKAAVSSRMKGLRGGRASRSAAGPGSLTAASSINEHLLGFGGTAPRQPSYVQARTDPKTFFANERTFLQWLQISVLVMMTGLGMLTGSTIAVSGGGACMDNLICSAARISGAIVAPVSILFMVYALYLYQKRTKQLLTRSTLRYDDARGPWLLTTLLILVTVVVIVLALESYRISAVSKG